MKHTIKRVLLFVTVALLSINMYSQNINDSFLKLDSILQVYKKDSLKIAQKKDSLNHLIYSQNWDTTTVNAYRDVHNSFPFEVSFTDSVYASPISKKHVVTSRYGWRRGRPHRGIDIDLVTGDSVFSILSGKVRFVGYSSGYGRTVVVRHDNGLETLYAHLSGYKVKKNDIVKKGQVIALGGNSGRSRGSHLHLETRYKGTAINPEYLLNFRNDLTIRGKNLWVTRDWARAYYHSSRRQSKLVTLDTYDKAIAYKKRKRKVYIVKSGDTLSGIAYKNRTSISRICKTNKIRKTTTLKIGQRLIL
ncbi:M23 family metallopeptidase [uncultured Tenacibaculum sp.]|uniref:M23 family metallopeptidase n=1 Tax=uncultured Tenacibaculum sp. TaxID=174713 RepID=UPI00262D6A2E|nr:M23 family metallopeptidase [uncultured Tenacibaculum sp.]